jgi:hypothetical protein
MFDTYEIEEIITDTACRECGDLLAPWEGVLCCICEAMAD